MGNKIFQKFALIWLIALAAFNVIVFVVPADLFGMPRQTESFWTGYVFITLAFLGNLACAWYALRADSPEKLFYNIPLLTISYSALITMLIIGGIFMAVPLLPVWLGVILCVLVLAFNAIAVIKANAAAEIVQNTEAKVKRQTSVMRELTMQAEGLIMQAKSEEVRAACQKVYEALRFSDPMSNEALSDIESIIQFKLKDFSLSIAEENNEVANKIAENLLILIEDRNRKCKVLK